DVPYDTSDAAETEDRMYIEVANSYTILGDMMLSDSQISAVRARFPIFRRAVYLNSCSQGALSDAVESSMHELLETWGRLGSPWDLWVEHYETARREFAAFLGAEPEEDDITGSVSAGISSIATACNLH